LLFYIRLILAVNAYVCYRVYTCGLWPPLLVKAASSISDRYQLSAKSVLPTVEL